MPTPLSLTNDHYSPTISYRFHCRVKEVPSLRRAFWSQHVRVPLPAVSLLAFVRFPRLAQGAPIRRNHASRVRLLAERLEDRITPSTTLNSLNGGLQIVIAGSDTVNLSTTGGKLVVNDITAGQSVIDTTGKFGVAGGTGNQTFFETANLATDFTSLTITGTGGGQTVNFIGGTFVATNVNDGTISTVTFSGSPSSFSGDLNVLSKTSLTIGAAVAGSEALNIIVGGTNAALNVNANATSQFGVVNLQATGDVKLGQGVSVVSATNTLTLGADLTPAGDGDNGVGTLTIGANVTVYAARMNLPPRM